MNKPKSFKKAQQVILWIIIAGVIAMAVFAIVGIVRNELKPRRLISMGGTVFQAEVVDTAPAREKGLSGRSAIGDKEAMLFVFEGDGAWPIWMKDMNFPIDIVWLDESQKVVHVEQDVQPDAIPYEVYQSPEPARYVIEVKSGNANVTPGSLVKFDITKEGL